MHQFEEEGIARELLTVLEQHLGNLQVAVQLAIGGAGVHWHVDAQAQRRACRVHTFHALSVRHPRAEYYQEWSEGGRVLARGRTRALQELPHALQAWLVEGLPLDVMYQRFPFIDQMKRELEAIGQAVDAVLARLGSALRTSLLQSTGDLYELWVYGKERSCRLESLGDGSHVRCTFHHLNLPIAQGETTDRATIASALIQWLDTVTRVDPLHREFPFVRLEDHAHAYEQGTLAEHRWNKAIAQAKKAQGRGGWFPLAPHLPLLEHMARSPAIRRFFFFTSHYRLCISRCPEYPFSTHGLPHIEPLSRKMIAADPVHARYKAFCGDSAFEGSAEDVCQFVEKILEAEGDTTFDGSLTDELLRSVDRKLAASGSELRCRRAYRGAGYTIVVEGETRLGQHQAVWLEDYRLPVEYKAAFRETGKGPGVTGYFRDLDALVRAIRLWIEDAVPLATLKEQSIVEPQR